MRKARFVEQGHSFRSHYQPREEGRDASGDVGEEISAAEAPNLHFFEVTSQRGPGDVGTVFGDLVYHNFYATRFNATSDQTLDGVVAADDSAGPGKRPCSGTSIEPAGDPCAKIAFGRPQVSPRLSSRTAAARKGKARRRTGSGVPLILSLISCAAVARLR